MGVRDRSQPLLERIHQMQKRPYDCVHFEGRTVRTQQTRLLERYLGPHGFVDGSPIRQRRPSLQPLPTEMIDGDVPPPVVLDHHVDPHFVQARRPLLVEAVTPTVVHSNSATASEDLASYCDP